MGSTEQLPSVLEFLEGHRAEFLLGSQDKDTPSIALHRMPLPRREALSVGLSESLLGPQRWESTGPEAEQEEPHPSTEYGTRGQELWV